MGHIVSKGHLLENMSKEGPLLNWGLTLDTQLSLTFPPLPLLVHPTISQEEDDEDSSTASDSDILTQDNYERAEKRPILSVRKSWAAGQALHSPWSAGLPPCLCRDLPRELPCRHLLKYQFRRPVEYSAQKSTGLRI